MQKKTTQAPTGGLAGSTAQPPIMTTTTGLKGLQASAPMTHVVESMQGLTMSNPLRTVFGKFNLPEFKYEEPCEYIHESQGLKDIEAELRRIKKECPEIALLINGDSVRTDIIGKQLIPSDFRNSICSFHKCTPEVLENAIEGALRAKMDWELMSLEDRALVFLKAADLLSNKYRAEVIATLMLGTGKNLEEAELDVVHAINYLRIHIRSAQEIYKFQPPASGGGGAGDSSWNRVDYRPLEGFVAAFAPFDFLSFEVNVACAPLMMGNVVIWKPSEATLLGCAKIWRILQEAGLPRGALQLISGDPKMIAQKLLVSPHLGGLYVGGSNDTIDEMLQIISTNISTINRYPRVSVEGGGNNFHFIHPSACDQLENIVNQTIRGAFEYSGQKCTSTSRVYVPQSLWATVKSMLVERVGSLKVGPPEDFANFCGPLIHEKLFDAVVNTIELAKKSDKCEIIVGGKWDKSKGYFVHPTILETRDPYYPTMTEELLGPILTVYVYPDSLYLETLQLCDDTSKYGLCGSIFASDRKAIDLATFVLRNCAGNFFVNDRTTSYVVGQQPLGGSRLSGSNDKSGTIINLLRWVSPRSIKENFVPLTDFHYPFMKK